MIGAEVENISSGMDLVCVYKTIKKQFRALPNSHHEDAQYRPPFLQCQHKRYLLRYPIQPSTDVFHEAIGVFGRPGVFKAFCMRAIQNAKLAIH